MKKLVWKLCFAIEIFRVLGFRELKATWEWAEASSEDWSESDPVEIAESELSYAAMES